MDKYLRALPVLTAESEQTKARTHLDLNDTKHHEDTNIHAAKEAENVMKITCRHQQPDDPSIEM